MTFPELECPCKKEVTIEAINEALEACPKIDEEVITQEAIECKECDGEGEVYWEYTDGHGHHHERLYDCPVCDGKGDIRPEIRKETGNQIVDENAIVKVGNAYIYAKYICKLKSAMLHLGVTSVELLFNSERKGNEFAIGDIRITLASMLFDYTCKCNAELKLIEL